MKINFKFILLKIITIFQINEQILEDLGTINLINTITKSNVPSQHFEKKRLDAIEQSSILANQFNLLNISNNQIQETEIDVIFLFLKYSFNYKF